MKIFLRRLLNCLAIIIAVIAIILFLTVVILVIFSLIRGYDSLKNTWELIRSTSLSLGPIGTLFAVIVALFKERFSLLLYSPDFEFGFQQQSVKPICSLNNSSIIEKYAFMGRISNKGTIDAMDCKVEIVSVEYNKNRKTNKLKRINPISQTEIQLSNSTVAKGDFSEFVLFEVDNPTAVATPTNSGTVAAKIRFSGIELKTEDTLKGIYVICYRVSYEHGVSETYKVTIDWAGEWSDDHEEMVDKFECKIK